MGGVLSLPSMGRRVRRHRPVPVPLAISHPRPLRPRARPLSSGAGTLDGASSPRRISTSSGRLSRSSWRSRRTRPRSGYTVQLNTVESEDEHACPPPPKRRKSGSSRRATLFSEAKVPAALASDLSVVPSSSATAFSDDDTDVPPRHGPRAKRTARPRTDHAHSVAGTKRASPDVVQRRKLRKLDDSAGVWFADRPAVPTTDVFRSSPLVR